VEVLPSQPLTDFLSLPGRPQPMKYYSLLRGEDLMQVHRHGVNLVVGRDLRRNVSYSAVIAQELADKGDRVMYLNTYAGEALLRVAFGGEQPPPDPRLEKAGEVDTPTRDIQIAHVPVGQWNIKKILPLLDDRDVLIINSFEFAALTRALKDRIAVDLVSLKEKSNITLIVFSHSMQRDLEARQIGRGAIGVLAAAADSVSRVGEEWAALARTATPGELGQKAVAEKAISAEYPRIAKVHEKRMLNGFLLPKKFGGERPNPTVDIPNDAGFSYHYADFWCNPFDRGPYADYTGRGMSLLARTPLLQKYLLDHPDTIFMQGNTPSEAKLMAEMTLG
jgi:hypothetical protein